MAMHGESIKDQEQGAKDEPSGPRAEKASTAGPASTNIRSATLENSSGKINPSAPGNTGTTPGSDPDV